MNRWILASVLGIALLAFVLRFYRLDEVPASLNPDEKFNAYLAYSLLRTGQDLWGNFFPVTTKTFGSYALIGYPVLTMIPVAVWGLGEFSARVVGAISGVLTGLIVIKMVANFFGKKVGLAAGLFLAISPWSLFFSRTSHETGLGLVFLLAGVWLVSSFNRNSRLRFWVFGTFFFAFSVLCHYAYFVVSPLIFGSVLVIFRKKLSDLGKRWLVGVGVFGMIWILVGWSIVKGSIGEVRDVGIFESRDLIYDRAERFRSDGAHETGALLEKVHSRYGAVAYQLAQNYLATFSSGFLFDKGGQKLLHNLGYFGNFHLFDFFFAFLGILFLAWRRRTGMWFFVFWAAVAPLASIFTNDHPSSTRLFPLVVPVLVFSAYGLSGLVGLLRNGAGRQVVAGLLAILIGGLVFYYQELYFFHLNSQRVRFMNYGYREAVLATQKYPDYQVISVGPENFAFISFLFYEKYDPVRFRKEVEYYPLKDNGFQFVKRFGRFSFVENVDRERLLPKTVYVDYFRPGDRENVIYFPNGDGAFTILTNTDLKAGKNR